MSDDEPDEDPLGQLDETTDGDPFEQLDDAGETDPFEQLEEPPDADVVDEDEAFVERSVDGVDEERVLEEVIENEGGVVEGSTTVDGEEAVVPKRSYCERCEFFSSPPTARCTNPGTEIVELVDVESFRVVDCPVVARRRGDTDIGVDPAADGPGD